MKLPIPFLNNKKAESKYYLALLLSDEQISSVIMQEEFGKIKIVGKHEEHLANPLETISQDELITLVDKSISRAEEILPPDIETHKTVFGVKEDWVESDTKKIKKEHLSKLKKVCEALDLSPIGFMVISEAIANLLQLEEGAPLSAILVELSRKTANITLFRGGKISESISGALVHSAPVTVDSLLKSFTAAVLPTKIILFHTKDAENLAHHFSTHEWSKSLPFLHLPKVTVLPPDFDAKAVAYGASQQMGFVALGIAAKTAPIADQYEEAAEEKEASSKPEEQTDEQKLTDETKTDFGFVENVDIAKTIHEVPSNVPDENIEDVPDDLPKQNSKKSFAGFAAPVFSLGKSKLSKLSALLTKNKGFKLPIIIIGIVVIALVGFILFYYNGVQAEIVLSVKPKKVTQEANITFSGTSSNDFSKNLIAAKSISTDVDGEVSTAATGKKDTGNKAKGTVTIFSKLPQAKTFTQGTVIKGNDLEFTLDKDTNVASSSGDASSAPSTAKVDVTAKEIGTESNLPTGVKFSINGFDSSDVVAKNDGAFSEGSKKTITVVSKTDIAKLRSDLPKNLEKKAIDNLSKDGENGETVLPGFISTTLKKEKFDNDVDEEAKQVKLNATVTFEGMSYQNSDLEDFDKTILKDKYSDNIIFAKNDIKNEVKNPKANKDKDIQATLQIEAGLLPKIDNQEVINKLKNKSLKQGKETLNTLPQISNSEIRFSPNILFLSNLFPNLPKNIKVTIKSDE